jgi:hypothetical protein
VSCHRLGHPSPVNQRGFRLLFASLRFLCRGEIAGELPGSLFVRHLVLLLGRSTAGPLVGRRTVERGVGWCVNALRLGGLVVSLSPIIVLRPGLLALLLSRAGQDGSMQRRVEVAQPLRYRVPEHLTLAHHFLDHVGSAADIAGRYFDHGVAFV